MVNWLLHNEAFVMSSLFIFLNYYYRCFSYYYYYYYYYHHQKEYEVNVLFTAPHTRTS